MFKPLQTTRGPRVEEIQNPKSQFWVTDPSLASLTYFSKQRN